MTSIKLKYVKQWIDKRRDGSKARFRFRRKGYKEVTLPGLPGSEEFVRAYAKALAGLPDVALSDTRTRVTIRRRLILERPRVEDGDWPPNKSHSSLVYFIRIGNAVKIGFSTQLEQRLKTFKTAAPHATVLAVFPGGRELEARLHSLFVDARISNELFQANSLILGFLRLAKRESLEAAIEHIDVLLAPSTSSDNPWDAVLTDVSDRQAVTEGKHAAH